MAVKNTAHASFIKEVLNPQLISQFSFHFTAWTICLTQAQLKVYEFDGDLLPSYSNDFNSRSAPAKQMSNIDMLRMNVPGVPGQDYTIFATVPQSSFTCDGKVDGGYYADADVGCQPFHVCANDGKGGLNEFSFLCPNGSLFNQEYFICDWWFNVDCARAESFYYLNEEYAQQRASQVRGSASNEQNYRVPAPAAYNPNRQPQPVQVGLKLGAGSINNGLPNRGHQGSSGLRPLGGRGRNPSKPSYNPNRVRNNYARPNNGYQKPLPSYGSPSPNYGASSRPNNIQRPTPGYSPARPVTATPAYVPPRRPSPSYGVSQGGSLTFEQPGRPGVTSSGYRSPTPPNTPGSGYRSPTPTPSYSPSTIRPSSNNYGAPSAKPTNSYGVQQTGNNYGAPSVTALSSYGASSPAPSYGSPSSAVTGTSYASPSPVTNTYSTPAPVNTYQPGYVDALPDVSGSNSYEDELPVANTDPSSKYNVKKPSTGYGVPLADPISTGTSSSYDSPTVTSDIKKPSTGYGVPLGEPIGASYKEPSAKVPKIEKPSTGYGVPLGEPIHSEPASAHVSNQAIKIVEPPTDYGVPLSEPIKSNSNYADNSVSSVVAPSTSYGVPLGEPIGISGSSSTSGISAPSTSYGVPLGEPVSSSKPSTSYGVPLSDPISSSYLPASQTTTKVEKPSTGYGVPLADPIG